jgi:hypothetical protein
MSIKNLHWIFSIYFSVYNFVIVGLQKEKKSFFKKNKESSRKACAETVTDC